MSHTFKDAPKYKHFKDIRKKKKAHLFDERMAEMKREEKEEMHPEVEFIEEEDED